MAGSPLTALLFSRCLTPHELFPAASTFLLQSDSFQPHCLPQSGSPVSSSSECVPSQTSSLARPLPPTCRLCVDLGLPLLGCPPPREPSFTTHWLHLSLAFKDSQTHPGHLSNLLFYHKSLNTVRGDVMAVPSRSVNTLSLPFVPIITLPGHSSCSHLPIQLPIRAQFKSTPAAVTFP